MEEVGGRGKGVVVVVSGRIAEKWRVELARLDTHTHTHTHTHTYTHTHSHTNTHTHTHIHRSDLSSPQPQFH